MTAETANPLDYVQVPPHIDVDLESPFQDFNTLTGFNAQAWIETGHPDTPLAKPIQPVDNAPTKTIYELVTTSETTSAFAKLVEDFPTIVSALQNTNASHTLFVPTNAAIERISQYLQHASRDSVENVLKYHLAHYNLRSSFLLITPTLPILYEPPALNGELRISFSTDNKGLVLGYYAHIIAFDILATNGTIHVVDSIVLPPPPVLQIIKLLPAEFSTFQLGLMQTGLADEIPVDSHSGLTVFAPRNVAFQKLGATTLAFLFSQAGKKHLRALLQYHFSPNKTLYSNAFYHEPRPEKIADPSEWKDVIMTGDNRPKGIRKFHLPAMLEGEFIDVVITRDGPEIDMRVNEYTTIAVKDGTAADGVVLVVDDVMFPGKLEETPTLAQVKDILAGFTL